MAKRGRPRAGTRKCATCGERHAMSAFLGPNGKRCQDCRAAITAKSRCKACGASTPLVDGITPRAYCLAAECQHARALRAGSAPKKPRPVKTHHVCPPCGERKERNTDNFGVSKRRADGSVKEWDGWCRSCRSAYERDRYASNPEYAERKRANTRACHAARWQAIKADPVKLEAHRASNRAAGRKARAARRAVEAARTRQPAGPEIPVGPLLQFVDGVVEREGLDFGTNAPHSANQTRQEVVCERLGVDPRRLSAWRSGEASTTRADLADRVMTNAGAFWWEVWPEGSEGHEAARAAFGDPELHTVD